MSEGTAFTLNGVAVEAHADETIWAVATRTGVEIPHLCHCPEPGYRPDGNCRACMVDIEGERVLAASCIRKPTAGMVVLTDSERARRSRAMVFELLVADQPARATAPDPDSTFWRWADRVGVTVSRFAPSPKPASDRSHVAMAVHLDACINCNLCVRACREVQMNDVIGSSYRGERSQITFDFDSRMGESTCVACGECVQACPTGALIEASLLDAEGARKAVTERTVDTVCPFCGVGCQTTVHISENRIVKVDGRAGPANENRLCVKGRFGYDYVAHPHRLTTPLIRRADAPKQWDQQIRDGEWSAVFREASWDEALDLAAEGLRAAHATGGSDAIVGFGSAKGSNEEAYLFQKLIRTAFHSNNVDHCTRLCHASSVAALMECVASGAVSAPFTDAAIADCIIAIGCNPAQNHPVAATYFKQAAARGTHMFVIDPCLQPLSRFAEQHLQFKPGTDVALLNALIHTIVEEALYDAQYVEANVDEFEALKAMIHEFSPEKMSGFCGIAADRLREVARTYATAERSMIFWGMGISQHIHGTDNSRCLITLALITGQIGRPGTGLHPLRGQNNVQGASDAGLIPMFYPDYKSVEDDATRKRFETLWGTALNPISGLTVVEAIDAIHNGVVKGMYVEGENPAMSDPDQTHARKALATLEHLVVQDIFLTETAWHADVVLPASAHAEKDGTFSNTNRQVQMGRQCIPPPGDARQDWWIISELGKRLGLAWNYEGPADIFSEMKQAMPSLDHITWERLKNESYVTYPCPSPESQGTPVLFADGFPTTSGRARIVPASIIPPDEVPDDDYPMILTTGRMLEHWHTGAMTRRATVLDALEPAAVVSLNRWDIKRYGLVTGKQVEIHTRRGTITLTARENPDIPEGMISIPFCFAEAPANVLTNPALDPFGKIPEFKFCAARIVHGPA
ncbi:MAG: formate dehydrogenase subunit alpha [Lentisphaerae bacterium]|nr:formate dehydrogenase subunit alpha [Lentisphaerota bacterium]